MGYDLTDRLKNVFSANSPSESYNYDAVGNRTSSNQSASYTYQPYNRLTSTATATYTYDANGTMTGKSEGSNLWRYNYDYENRLVEASTRKRTVRYRYDALGRRIQRYFIKGGSENTKFTYDGQDVVMDNNDGVITKYQNGLGIDNKLKLTTNGTSRYFLQDHLGSTNALTNSSGNITESTSYDSFGNSTNNLSTRYSYTGREYDSFTGLYYYRARFYDAKLGRFISEDPIGFAGGDVNLFGYVKNNPVMMTDPKGEDYLIYEKRTLTWIYESPGNIVDAGGFIVAEPPTETGRKTWNANSGCDEGCPSNKDYSPIPLGTYTTEPTDKTDHSGSETAWGPFSYRLHEGLFTRLSNRLSGRDGGFHIHGGFNVGTAGCIEFANYDPDQKWLKDFDKEMQQYGKEITLYVR